MLITEALTWCCARATIRQDSRTEYWKYTRSRVSASVSVQRPSQRAVLSWMLARRPTSSAMSWMVEVLEMWSSMRVPRKLLSVNNGELRHHQCQVFASKGFASCMDRIYCNLGTRRTECGDGYRSDENRRWSPYMEQPAVCRTICIHRLRRRRPNPKLLTRSRIGLR